LLPPDVIFYGYKFNFGGGSAPRTPLGELTAVLKLLAGFQGFPSKPRRGREERGGRGEINLPNGCLKLGSTANAAVNSLTALNLIS